MIRLPPQMKIAITLLGVTVFGTSLLYAISAVPDHGAVYAPAHRDTSPIGSTTPGTYYLRNAYADAKTPNVVTVVLADYRSFDTLGETTVVFCGAVCVMLLLRAKFREWR
ncbi:MAG: hydrogen gas-evolving membrane-bound hydrogenase subunit E [Planctomycetota bacterium]